MCFSKLLPDDVIKLIDTSYVGEDYIKAKNDHEIN